MAYQWLSYSKRREYMDIHKAYWAITCYNYRMGCKYSYCMLLLCDFLVTLVVSHGSGTYDQDY